MWRQGDDTLFSKVAIVLKLRYHCAIYFAILFLFPALGDIRKYWSYLCIMRNNVFGEAHLFICKTEYLYMCVCVCTCVKTRNSGTRWLKSESYLLVGNPSPQSCCASVSLSGKEKFRYVNVYLKNLYPK